ncbi:MAG: leucine-rich repeat domain-containing protein, partial [Thermoguttaceae bacterium]|nr:leucine-rich repeat domain-containing protein [Thermoguttaceae bacterium]
LTSVEIPDGVETVGDDAFAFCRSLTSVKIPASVKKIGVRAFNNCDSLTSVEIPASVEKIDGQAFEGCSADLTLYGAAGSVAEKYAAENGLRFEAR